jgi:hypothetical protein
MMTPPPTTTTDDELAFCTRMASLLTQSRDLPKLCHSFPTVVRIVKQNRLADDDVMHQHHHHHQHYAASGTFDGSGATILAHSSIMRTITKHSSPILEKSIGSSYLGKHTFAFVEPTSDR